MPFHQKSAITMAAILVIVYGSYFAAMGRWLTVSPPEDIPYQPFLIAATIPLAILAAFSHVVLALINPGEANVFDERDRRITLRGEQVGGYVLATGVFLGIVLAMVEAPYFFVANSLLLAWVLAQVSEYLTSTVLYQRGIGV